MKITTCRSCNNSLKKIFSLGNIPLVNYYLTKKEIAHEKTYELTLCICTHCGLAQLNQQIPPKLLFQTYHYVSATSAPLIVHLHKLAKLCKRRFGLSEKSSVLDIGCNDGTLLSGFLRLGIEQLMGIDPAKNVIATVPKTIPTIADFFSLRLAKKVHKKYSFDLITATNALAQTDNLHDVLDGIALLLKKDGVFVAEVGYVLDMIQKKTFDSLYHEHYVYFSIESSMFLFRKHGLFIFDIEHIGNHGGSLRIFATKDKTKKQTERLNALLTKEKKYKLKTTDAYKKFSLGVLRIKKSLVTLLERIHEKKQTIIGVGSPAKAVVLLNFLQVDKRLIPAITDTTPYKQYTFMPGTHIPILPESYIASHVPDYFFLLAWTYKDELLGKLTPFLEKGKHAIIPLPKLEIY